MMLLAWLRSILFVLWMAVTVVPFATWLAPCPYAFALMTAQTLALPAYLRATARLFARALAEMAARIGRGILPSVL